MKFECTKRFEKQLLALDVTAARQVAVMVDRLVAGFGNPHLHAGLGVRVLTGTSAYEFRVSLAIRVIFWMQGNVMIFRIIGSHDDGEAWKRNNA